MKIDVDRQMNSVRVLMEDGGDKQEGKQWGQYVEHMNKAHHSCVCVCVCVCITHYVLHTNVHITYKHTCIHTYI